MGNDFLPRRSHNRYRAPVRRSEQAWERPATFRTPEQVAADEPHQQSQPHTPTTPPFSPGGSPPKKRRSLKEWLKSLSKKQWALLITALVVLLAGIGFAVYHFWIKSEPPKVIKKTEVKKTPPPKVVEPIKSTLTGLPVADATINQRPVTAVMIENSPDARPQAGLNQAGVIFEAIAEGGITRFLTLFQDTEPDYIGPVRSVRPYYVQWLAGFDAAVAHVGGSADALAMLRAGQAKDLDQFANPGPYHRVRNRAAPHNMYSSVVALRELQQSKGFTSTYTGFARKAEAKNAAPYPTVINMNISGAIYNPQYNYDAATNTYKRSQAGTPHIDERSGQQLAPKVVISLVLPQGRNGVYTTYQTFGSGEAFVFQDGTMTKGTWHKAGLKDPLTFTDANGAPLKLIPGQTWISAVGGADRVTFR